MAAVGSTFFNLMVSRIGPIINHVGRLRRVDHATSGIFQVLDVAGYNYGGGAYRATGRRHPGRVVVGTETLPGDIVRNWQLVEELPYVIGDFMWTGWDYLGEAGVAAWSYGTDRKFYLKRYPYLLAAAGAIDITGLPGAMAFHAQTAWGQRHEPAIVVRPLDRVGDRVLKSPWRTTDAIANWSWDGHEGTETEVVVFSASEHRRPPAQRALARYTSGGPGSRLHGDLPCNLRTWRADRRCARLIVCSRRTQQPSLSGIRRTPKTPQRSRSSSEVTARILLS